MPDAIIVALIALAGEIIIAAVQHSGLISKLEKQSEVADTKMRGELDVVRTEMTALRQEVQKHNNLVERTYRLEQTVAVHEEKIKVANNRIADLEKKQAG